MLLSLLMRSREDNGRSCLWASLCVDARALASLKDCSLETMHADSPKSSATSVAAECYNEALDPSTRVDLRSRTARYGARAGSRTARQAATRRRRASGARYIPA